MLCSEAELDLGLNAAGILELDSTLRSGELIRDVLDLDDYVVDIDLTPNRGDCFSICGVAREVGVYNRQRVRRPEIAAVQIKGTRELSIYIEDEAGCPRYLGRIIQGIDITRPTPLWMLNRLRGCGLRSINAVVDTTNYVMLELGQPMHAFDLAHVEKGIGVRKARAGESLMLLDGSSIDLDTQTLLITSDDQPVAMAGVMGGIDSGIQDSTSDIFLECAFFAPEAIMGTARRYGLHTNASIRYERGVDYNIQFQALDRLTELLVEIVGGTVCPTTVAETTFLPESSSVEISENRLRALIGEVIPKSTVTEIFELLDFGTLETDGGWRVDVPSHRFDIALEEDLVEEVCRVYGYNSIESRLPDAKPMIEKDTNFTYESRSAKNKLKELGYAEVMTYSFVDPELQHAVKRGLNQLMLQNPMATDRSAMRASLLPGLLESLKYNLSRQQETVRLFEVGLCFHQIDDKNVSQENRTAGIAIGTRWPTSWAHSYENVDFYDIKGDIEALFGSRQSRLNYVPTQEEFLHPGRSATIEFKNEIVGFLGQLHPQLMLVVEISEPVYYFELDSEKLFEQADVRVEPISQYPSVRRDLALVLNQSTPVQEIENAIREYLGDKLIDYRLFDVYTGEGIGDSEKSVAVSLTMQDINATLTDEFVRHALEKILAKLESKLSARLR